MDLIAFHRGASLDAQFGLGMVRLWRIRRIAAFFKSLERRVSLSYNAVNMVNGALLILTDCHLFACLFWYIGRRRGADPAATWAGAHNLQRTGEAEPRDVSGQYFQAVYFAITTMAMGGFGDFLPMNQGEQFAAMALVAVNYALLLCAAPLLRPCVFAFRAPISAQHPREAAPCWRSRSLPAHARALHRPAPPLAAQT